VLEFPLLPGGTQTQRNVNGTYRPVLCQCESMRDEERRPYVAGIGASPDSRQAGNCTPRKRSSRGDAGVDIDEAKMAVTSSEKLA